MYGHALDGWGNGGGRHSHRGIGRCGGLDTGLDAIELLGKGELKNRQLCIDGLMEDQGRITGV